MSTPMAETQSAPSLRELSEAAPKGPWTVRPQKFDDWGWVRGPLREDGFRPVIFVAKGDDDEAEQSAARAEGRQPRQTEAISAFLCRLENDYRAGRLIDPTTLTEAVAAARAESWQPIETAPKDGTHVDLWLCEHSSCRQWREADVWFERGSWIGDGEADGIRVIEMGSYWTATHWMPLPAPPTTPGGRTDG